MGLILSFGTFSFGFIARPLGGILFGHFGDRLGRKRTLVVALILMGVASTLIGLLPTYSTIGIAAPILLSLLRFTQGLAIGGQWGGAMLLVTENAPADKRGYYGAYAQAGVPFGIILANLAFMIISATVSEEFFMQWGWRIPFVASVILIGISMYVQLNLEDTEAFKELEAKKALEKADSPAVVTRERSPVLEAIVKYPKQIALTAGAFILYSDYVLCLDRLHVGLWHRSQWRRNVSGRYADRRTDCFGYSNTDRISGCVLFGQTWSPRNFDAGGNTHRHMGLRDVSACRHR